MAEKPELRAYTVNQYGKGADRTTRWTEIGAAWRTQNGNLRIQLEAVPVNGQIILMPPKDHDATNGRNTDQAGETDAVG